MTLLFAFMWLLAVHFVADFVLQSDWMAKNKSKSNEALALHVLIYGITISFGIVPVVVALGLESRNAVGLWMLGNTAAHWATDYVTSRINSKLWAEQRVHAFFVGVGADQLIHSLTLGLSLAWLAYVVG